MGVVWRAQVGVFALAFSGSLTWLCAICVWSKCAIVGVMVSGLVSVARLGLGLVMCV